MTEYMVVVNNQKGHLINILQVTAANADQARAATAGRYVGSDKMVIHAWYVENISLFKVEETLTLVEIE